MSLRWELFIVEGNQLKLVYNCLSRALFIRSISFGVQKINVFGVIALEIVSGKSNTNYRPKEEFVYLID